MRRGLALAAFLCLMAAPGFASLNLEALKELRLQVPLDVIITVASVDEHCTVQGTVAKIVRGELTDKTIPVLAPGDKVIAELHCVDAGYNFGGPGGPTLKREDVANAEQIELWGQDVRNDGGRPVLMNMVGEPVIVK